MISKIIEAEFRYKAASRQLAAEVAKEFPVGIDSRPERWIVRIDK